MARGLVGWWVGGRVTLLLASVGGGGDERLGIFLPAIGFKVPRYIPTLPFG